MSFRAPPPPHGESPPSPGDGGDVIPVAGQKLLSFLYSLQHGGAPCGDNQSK